MRAAVAALVLAIGIGGCATHPPQGTGGAAETARGAAWPPPAYWTGAPIHPDLRAELPDGTDLGPGWVAGQLETISCLDFRLEGLGTAGASALFPAEIVLARADRRRALRALMGGLPHDGAVDVDAYRLRVNRLEDTLRRAGRPVNAVAVYPPC